MGGIHSSIQTLGTLFLLMRIRALMERIHSQDSDMDGRIRLGHARGHTDLF
jgi:hypothetical protein